MKIAMIYPNRESEKAISGYSSTLVENIRKAKVKIDDLNYYAGSPNTLLKKFKEFKKYDIIHLQHEYNLLGGYGLPFFILYFLFSLSGCKVITTMHTVLSQEEKFKGSKIKTLFRKFLYLIQNRWINWFSDIVVVHADFFSRILIKEYGFKKDKIKIFPQGIIEDIPHYNKQKIKKELKLSGRVYLFMGGMVPDHGHDIAIRQADKIGKTILVVANPGSVNDRKNDRVRAYIDDNEKIVKENHFEKFVRFDISEEITDKNPLWWKYFCAADLILLPYRGGIGSGIFAHAIAAQRPVIASNIQYFNEIAKNYGCIKIATNNQDFPSTIKKAINSKNYKKMVQECKRYLKENGLSVIGIRYKKLYSSLK